MNKAGRLNFFNAKATKIEEKRIPSSFVWLTVRFLAARNLFANIYYSYFCFIRFEYFCVLREMEMVMELGSWKSRGHFLCSIVLWSHRGW